MPVIHSPSEEERYFRRDIYRSEIVIDSLSGGFFMVRAGIECQYVEAKGGLILP
jgi:hypothetical protein